MTLKNCTVTNEDGGSLERYSQHDYGAPYDVEESPSCKRYRAMLLTSPRLVLASIVPMCLQTDVHLYLRP